MYFMGVDVGGTKIEVAIFETDPLFHYYNYPKLHKLASERIPTQRQNGYLQVKERLIAMSSQLLAGLNIPKIALSGVGIGLPGPVHPQSEMMIHGNSQIFINQNIRQDLKENLGLTCPIVCANDANCFALAETLIGAGRSILDAKKDSVCIGIILGTGVGGGLVWQGRTLVGRTGSALEVGHSELITNGVPCYCGNTGCVEQYLSGPGLEAQFAVRMYSQIPHRPSSAEIFELAKKKDPIAIAVVNQYKNHLAKFLANLTQLFNPDAFILGGGVSLQDAIYENLDQKIHEHLFVKEAMPKVLKHEIGDSAGIMGAVFQIMANELV